MSEKNKRLLHTVYGLILALAIIAVGVCFAVSCVVIYKSGASPFTRESIAERYSHISIPVFICILLAVGGAVLNAVLPVEKARGRMPVDDRKALKRMLSRLNTAACGDEVLEGMQREERLRPAVRGICAITCTVCAVIPLTYLLNVRHFTVENLNADVIAAVLHLLPCACVAFAACISATLINGASIRRELSMIKSAGAVFASVAKSNEREEMTSTRARLSDFLRKHNTGVIWTVRGVIFCVCAVFIVLGVLNGGMRDVLEKAIKICTECIGLG